MEWKEGDESQLILQWRSLLATLRQALDLSNHHNLLLPLQDSVKLLSRYHIELSRCNLRSDLNLLLDTCKRLDEVAHEKHYREQLAHNIIDPLIKSLRTSYEHSWLLMVENYIRQHINYGSYGEIRYNSLCDHQLTPMDLHLRYICYLQANPEQYDQAAIVIRVIDYWRHLKNHDPQIFVQSNIEPLQHLSEHLFVIIQKTESQLRKKELWRLIILLQILLVDHPDFEKRVVNTNCTILEDYKPVLKRSREVFVQKEVDVLTAQREHTLSVISMLREMVKSILAVLGKAPCDLAICVLGSTSRYDRRPYSDVELLILHNEVEEILGEEQQRKWQQKVDDYIHHLVCILELMVVRLGETHDIREGGNAGFHLDSSCHILMKKTWGTAQEIFERFIKVRSHEPETHPWIDSEVLYALLQPCLLHPGEFGADDLMHNYQELLSNYLSTETSEEDNVSIINHRFGLVSKNTWIQGLTRHEGIALVCLYDVVQKSVNSLNSLVPNHYVDIKQVYYKPLLYFALNLRLYFNWSLASPLEIIHRYTKEFGLNGESFRVWWCAAFTYVVQYQINIHLESGHQEETVNYPVYWTATELHFWSGLDLINQGLIKPLHLVLSQWFTNKMQPFQELIKEHVKHSFSERQYWIKKWSERGMDRHALLTHPLIGKFTQRKTLVSLLENFKVLAEQYSYNIALAVINASLTYLEQVEVVDVEIEDQIIDYVFLPYFKNKTEFEPILVSLTNLEEFARFLDKINCTDEIFISITKHLLNTSVMDKASCRENAYRWYYACGNISRQCHSMLMQSDLYGFRLKEIILREKLEGGICSLDKNSSMDCTASKNLPEVVLIRRTSDGEQKILLSHAIVEKIINLNTGHIQHHPNFERSPDAYEHRAVNFTDHCGFKLHFKEHPDFPLMAVFNHLLHMRIMGTGSTPVEIVLFKVIIKNEELLYPVLISLTVPGINFKYVLDHSPKSTLSHIAIASGMVMDAIKHAGDGYPRNYVVTDDVNNQELICVDGEQIFVNSFSENGLISKRKVQEISIYYCLPEFHREGVLVDSLPHDVIVKLAEINVEKVLEDCLNELDTREKLDRLLYKGQLERFIYRHKKHPYTGDCLLAEGLIGKLTIDLRTLHTIAKRALANKVSLTAQNVLAICAGQNCADLYFNRELNCSPTKLLQQIAGRTNTMSSSDYSRFYLGKLTKSYSDLRMRRYDIDQAKQEIYRCQYVHFSEAKELGGDLFSSFEEEKTLLLEFNDVNDEIANQHIYRLINSNIYFTQLIIKSCKILTDDMLMKLLENSCNTLQLLNIQDLSQITENTLFLLADKFPKLIVLCINNIGATFVYKRVNKILFKNLYFLSIKRCSKLLRLDFVAPRLVYFECKENRSLSGLSTNVPRLFTLRLYEVSSLLQLHIIVNSYCDFGILHLSKTCKITFELINADSISKKITDLDALSDSIKEINLRDSIVEESSKLDTINIIIIGSELVPSNIIKAMSAQYQNKNVITHLFNTEEAISAYVFRGIKIAIIIYNPERQNSYNSLANSIKNVRLQSHHPVPILIVSTSSWLQKSTSCFYDVIDSYSPGWLSKLSSELSLVFSSSYEHALFFHDIIFRQVKAKGIANTNPFILPRGISKHGYNVYFSISVISLGSTCENRHYLNSHSRGYKDYCQTKTQVGIFSKKYKFNEIPFSVGFLACSEIDRSLRDKLIEEKSLVLIVESVNTISEFITLQRTPFWYLDFQKHDDPSVPWILIGINSKDPHRKTSYQDARKYAEELGFRAYFECDLNSMSNINEAIEGSIEYFIAYAGFWRWVELPYAMSQHVIEGKIVDIPNNFISLKGTLPLSRSNSKETVINEDNGAVTSEQLNQTTDIRKRHSLIEADNHEKSTYDIVTAATQTGLFSPHNVRKASSREKIMQINESINEDENSLSNE